MSRSRLRTIPSNIPKTGKFHLVSKVNDVQASIKKKYGLDINRNESILPKAVGSASRFNANGRFVLLKTKPKEERYIRTIQWSWKEWGNDEIQTAFKDIYRECYQRDYILPPSFTISLMELDGEDYYCLGPLEYNKKNEESIIHAINLFLEIFGEYQISINGQLLKTKLKSVSWTLLPVGKYPFEEIEGHLRRIIGESPRVIPVITDRQKFLLDLEPKEVIIGQGGFSNYMAYKIDSFVILESIKIDNAMYVFKGKWTEVSKLTKKEIIQGKLAHKRIIHTTDWKEKLKKTLGIE